jgi:hypothetical protein
MIQVIARLLHPALTSGFIKGTEGQLHSGTDLDTGSSQNLQQFGHDRGALQPVTGDRGSFVTALLLLLSVCLFEHCQRFGEVGLKVAAHDIQYIDQQGITDGVKYLISLFTAENNLLGAQNSEMLRGICLLDSQPLDKITRRLFAVAQHFYNGDTCGVRERLKDVGLKAPKAILYIAAVLYIAHEIVNVTFKPEIRLYYNLKAIFLL